MSKYQSGLPQLSGDLFITDGGLETTLLFHEGLELPSFAAFDLLKHEEGAEALRRYFRSYLELAQRHGVGILLESATWRASSDWGQKLGYSERELADLNRRAVELLHDIRAESGSGRSRVVISGCIGPRGDGYRPETRMTASEAEAYHARQVGILREADADMIGALTMTYVEEAIGIARAAEGAGMPAAISFTVETDGRLPTGQTLREAVERVDEATGSSPSYYMVNCAHPTHFENALAADDPWVRRLRGIRGNASTASHAELDEAEELDEGDPEEFGRQCRELWSRLPGLNVLGGCCGTDRRHIEAICRACLPG